jgi:hypothetical protein
LGAGRALASVFVEAVVTKEVTMDMIVIELATSLGRHCALSDRESRWLEASVRRELRRTGQACRPRWETRDDQMLKRLLRRGKKPRDIARQMVGRTEQAIWSRIRFLRRRGKIGYICEQSPVDAPGDRS